MELVKFYAELFSPEQYIDFFIRIIVACLCGACIGFERSRRFKEAGIRTHIIVCCASAAMMIVSKYGFVDLANSSGLFFTGTKDADPARIAAQVISGISFLGAGVIFKNGNTIKGLTTAAGIWATAGIGLAIGSGMYALGLFVTILIAVLQFLMHKFKIGADSFVTSKLQFTVSENQSFKKDFFDQVDAWKAQIEEIKITEDDGIVSYKVTLRAPHSIKTEDYVKFFKEKENIHNFSVIPVV